jgi:hypothetical protein
MKLRFGICLVGLCGLCFVGARWARRSSFPTTALDSHTVSTAPAANGHPAPHAPGSAFLDHFLNPSHAGPQAMLAAFRAAPEDSALALLLHEQLIAAHPFTALEFLDPVSKDLVAACQKSDSARTLKLCQEKLGTLGAKGFEESRWPLWEPLMDADPNNVWTKLSSTSHTLDLVGGLTESLFIKWAASNPAAAIQAADSLPWGKGGWVLPLFITKGLAKSNPDAAIAYFTNLPDDRRASIGLIGILGGMEDMDQTPPRVALHLLGEQWANYAHHDDLSKAVAALAKPGATAQELAATHGKIYNELDDFRGQMRAWAATDPQAALRWASQFPQPDVSAAVQAAMTAGIAAQASPAEAEQLLENAAPWYRNNMISDMAEAWTNKPLADTWKKIDGFTSPETREQLKWEILAQETYNQPAAALPLIQQMSDDPRKEELLNQARDQLWR